MVGWYWWEKTGGWGRNHYTYQIKYIYAMGEQWGSHHTYYIAKCLKKKKKKSQKEFVNTYIYELKRSDYRWFHLRSFSSRCRSIATVTFPLQIKDSCFNSVTLTKWQCHFLMDKNNIMNRSKEIEHMRQLQTSKHQDKFSSSLNSKCRSPN